MSTPGNQVKDHHIVPVFHLSRIIRFLFDKLAINLDDQHLKSKISFPEQTRNRQLLLRKLRQNMI